MHGTRSLKPREDKWNSAGFSAVTSLFPTDAVQLGPHGEGERWGKDLAGRPERRSLGPCLGCLGGLSRMTATLPAETTADILIICSMTPEGRVIIIQPMLNTSPASYSYDYQGLHLISNHMA